MRIFKVCEPEPHHVYKKFGNENNDETINIKLTGSTESLEREKGYTQLKAIGDMLEKVYQAEKYC